MTEKDEHINYNTNEFKKELLMSKLMKEKIPENNTIKKYLEKDKVDFTIKLEDKEEIFLYCFSKSISCIWIEMTIKNRS